MSLRLSADGSYWAPRRGLPPKCPEGFMNHESNPWRCVPTVTPCEYRTLESYQYAPCGCTKTRVDCAYLERKTTLEICRRCETLSKEKLATILGVR